MKPKKVHRYKAKADGEAIGSWRGAHFIKDNYYGVTALLLGGKPDPLSVVVSGDFRVKDEVITKNLLIEKISCQFYLIHDPIIH